ncbi:hypothetical protein R6Q59_002461 [Mikania micrantha]
MGIGNVHADYKVCEHKTCTQESVSDNFVQITGEPEAVKKALFAVSTIMYKFPPKEDISLQTSVLETPPSIIFLLMYQFILLLGYTQVWNHMFPQDLFLLFLALHMYKSCKIMQIQGANGQYTLLPFLWFLDILVHLYQGS